MNKNRFYLWTILYMIVLDFVYIIFVTPKYAFLGLTLDISISKCVISTFLFVIMLIITPMDQSKPSNQLLQLMLMTTFIPIISIYWVANKPTLYAIFVTLCYVIFSIILRYIKLQHIPVLQRVSKYTINLVDVLFSISIIIFIGLLIKYGGIDRRALSFATIYELREDVVYSGIWAYLVSWLSKVLIPVCIILYLHQKRYFFFIASALMQLLLYLSNGQKTTLLSIGIIFIFYVLLKRDMWISALPKLYILIMSASVGLYMILKNIWGIAIFPVRMLNIPANISFLHYEFFSINRKLFFSEGLIGRILGISSPYDIRSTYIVSYNSVSQANTGYLGDAYDNAGFLLMIVFTIGLAFLFLLIDSISANSKNTFIYTVLFTYQIITLNDAALLTSLLTCGFSILLVLSYFYVSEERNQEGICNNI